MNRTNLTLAVAVSLASFLTASGCGSSFHGAENIQTTDSAAAVASSKVDLNLHPMDRNVCDPFTGGTSTSMTKGIQGQLFYKTSSMPIFHQVEDYMSSAQKSDKTLFFSDMNVPTRLFNQGFSTQTSGVLTDDTGATLIEYFGIRFDTTIMLSATDDEGDYEFSVLADDGVRMRTQNSDGTWTEIINNDGDHPTKMGCMTKTVHMTHSTQLVTQLDYYQGPRYEIANVLMWRKASVAGQDSSCGQLGNYLYFDPDHASAPQKAYTDLLGRGWKPLTADNFFVDQSTAYNPCVQGTNPVITNFHIVVTDAVNTQITLAWTTDIAPSSQVRFINESTGAEVLTTSDNLLRTSHNVTITGLSPNTTYQAQAVSVSQDLGTSISSTLTFTTTP